MKVEIYQKKEDGTLGYQVFELPEETFAFYEKKEGNTIKTYWRIYGSKLDEEYDPSKISIMIDGADLEYIYAKMKSRFDPKNKFFQTLRKIWLEKEESEYP